jgi:hypothetical protein
MSKAGKRGLAAGAALLVVGGGVFVALHRGGRATAPHEQAGTDGAGRWRGFAAGVPGMPGAAGEAAPGTPGAPTQGAEAPVAEQQRLETAMGAWRTAILVKDSDTVVTLDRAFAENPNRFTPALVKSAEGDDNERVRAFSTRVLGKFKAADLADVFQRLLSDQSPYVRQNAAWALGELGARPGGREAAQGATAELRRVESHDPVKDVRAAASGALKRLQ